MREVDFFLDEIDSARIQRIKELSEIKYTFGRIAGEDSLGVVSKAVVILTYANWEGFYNECTRTYIRFLKEIGKKVREVDWMLLLGVLGPDFNALKDRDHSLQARHEFVKNLQIRVDCGFDSFDATSVEAKSNLNYYRLSMNYAALNFDLFPLQKYRNRLDKELVGWRHGAAHGDTPDLSRLDINDHVDFASSLLLEVAGCFQIEIMTRF